MNTVERAIEALRRIADPKLTPSDGDPVVLREHARDALAALEAERAASAPAREALIQRLRERLRIVSLDTDTEQAILDAIDALATPAQAVPLEPTRAMIEAGAQRLVSWEDGCTWPDSWSGLQVVAARNDAERTWRSMWLAAAPQPAKAPQPLTDEQIEQCISDWSTQGWGHRRGELTLIARAIERAHGITGDQHE
jgi:hypothetical protein